jgi:hypothetical protein
MAGERGRAYTWPVILLVIGIPTEHAGLWCPSFLIPIQLAKNEVQHLVHCNIKQWRASLGY